MNAVGKVPDPYRDIRHTMAAALDELANGIKLLAGVLVDRLDGPAKRAAIAEFSPLLTAATFAAGAAAELRQLDSGYESDELFDSLERAGSSITSAVMLMRVIEFVG